MKQAAIAVPIALLCTIMSAVAAFGFPIAAPGTECLPVLVSSTENIIARYEGNSATYSNDLWLELDAAGNAGLDGDRSNDRLIFNNHTSPVGSQVDLGSFPAGVELVFRLHVTNTGNHWYTGPASRNVGGQCRARVQGNWMPNTSLVSFEDHVDFAYNDLSFSFTNVGTVFCPEGIAFIGVAYSSAIQASGGTPPYTFGVVGPFPPGLNLDTTTGAITGTPTTVGDFDFEATATGANSVTARANCRITVTHPTPTTETTWGRLKLRYR